MNYKLSKFLSHARFIEDKTSSWHDRRFIYKFLAILLAKPFDVIQVDLDSMLHVS